MTVILIIVKIHVLALCWMSHNQSVLISNEKRIDGKWQIINGK